VELYEELRLDMETKDKEPKVVEEDGKFKITVFPDGLAVASWVDKDHARILAHKILSQLQSKSSQST